MLVFEVPLSSVSSLKFKRSPTLTTFQWNWGNQVCVLPACQKQAPSRNPLELRHLYTWPSKPCRSIVQHTVLLFRVGLRCKKASWESDFLELCLRIGQSEAKLLRPKQEMLEAQVNLGRELFASAAHITTCASARCMLQDWPWIYLYKLHRFLVRAEVRGFLSIFERPHFGQGRNCATPTAKWVWEATPWGSLAFLCSLFCLCAISSCFCS